MRIISGKFKGSSIKVPGGLPVRPTTDICKESLFNIIENAFHIEKLKVLDLFSGTGNISYEFASRGASEIIAVDSNFKCYSFIKNEFLRLEIKQSTVIKADVIKYLEKATGEFDIIFADPPYEYQDYGRIVELVFSNHLLAENGWLILEHSKLTNTESFSQFKEKRIYGQSILSFFSLIKQL